LRREEYPSKKAPFQENRGLLSRGTQPRKRHDDLEDEEDEEEEEDGGGVVVVVVVVVDCMLAIVFRGVAST